MDIPFESFAALVRRLGHPPPDTPPPTIFKSWIAAHARGAVPGTGKRLFRLMYPEDGARRRYDLKETRLAAEISAALGVDLGRWDAVASGLGCLGLVVEAAAQQRQAQLSCSISSSSTHTTTLTEVDALLDQLAAVSSFSNLSQPTAPSPHTIHALFRQSNLSPYALGVLTQIILRDLRPLLLPVPRAHPTAQLQHQHTARAQSLGLHAAMWAWNPAMARLYRDGKGCVDYCADAAETNDTYPPGPVLGINVQIPKCQKGRSAKDAYRISTPAAGIVFAETKYDGYRMQIHVTASGALTVFSKSKRNSTRERRNAHPIVRAALGMAPDVGGTNVHPRLQTILARAGPCAPRIRASVILEAEVVPWSDARNGGRGAIEEFWRLPAAGVHVDDSSTFASGSHLCLVFFDILHLDGASLLREPIAAREEGLVLKAENSLYNDTRLPWIKLKKDYVPGLGDSVDLVLLGAGWDIDRARDLRVDTSVYTTFYIGTLTQARPPHFDILFRVSYGLDRAALEQYNAEIRLGRWPSRPYDRDDPWKRRLVGLPYRYTISPSLPPPSVLFDQPLCAEVMGAGFQKLPSGQYELRWPRLLKIFPKSERAWTHALRAEQLKAAAHQALGYTSQSDDDSLRMLWRSCTSAVDIPDMTPSPNTPMKRPFASMGDIDVNINIKSSPVSPTARLAPLGKRRRVLAPTPSSPTKSPAKLPPKSPTKSPINIPIYTPIKAYAQSSPIHCSTTPLSLRSRIRRAKHMSMSPAV